MRPRVTQVIPALVCLMQGVSGRGMERRLVVIQSLSNLEPNSVRSIRKKRSLELGPNYTSLPRFQNSTYSEEKFSELSTFEPKSISRLSLLPNSRDAEEKFSSVFYPLTVFITSIFVLFTIFIYVIIGELRQNIFGKLTLGFLINVFITYFTAGIVHSLNYFDRKQTYVGSWGCIVCGYIIQHTYVAILFWTNAMAFTLIKTFSNVLLHSVKRVDSKKKVFLTIIYAQGKYFTYVYM